MNLKKIGKVFTSKFVGTGPSFYKKKIYRAPVSKRLGNTALETRNFYRFFVGWPLGNGADEASI